MKKNNSFPGKFLLSFFSVFLILIAGAVFLFVYFASPVSGKDDSVSYKVKVSDGESLKSVSRELQNIGVIKNAGVLYYAARFNIFNRSQKFNLKSGLYTVSSSMSLKEIYMLLQSGQQEYISVVIPEGLNFYLPLLLLPVYFFSLLFP